MAARVAILRISRIANPLLMLQKVLSKETLLDQRCLPAVLKSRWTNYAPDCRICLQRNVNAARWRETTAEKRVPKTKQT